MSGPLERKIQWHHELWLGMVQPVEGLVLSIPTLVETQIHDKQPLEVHHQFLALTSLAPNDADNDALAKALPGAKREENGTQPGHVPDLRRFLRELMGWEDEILLGGGDLDDALGLWVPEGQQHLAPSFALKNPHYDPIATPPADRGTVDSPAAKAGAELTLLVWDVPLGLPLDSPETTTGEWHYPPVRKFERLLRHVQVPVGILTNREEFRLLYVPHGESMGAITFRLADMASTGGRPIFDAFMMLLTADALFSDPAKALPTLCRKSRQHQADVTEELARQVFEALDILLEGFEGAARRDDAFYRALDDALKARAGGLASGYRDADTAYHDNHLYGGILAVLLRLVFVLYAEDNGILPTDHPLYQEHLSLLGLFHQLRDDAGAYPDSMDRRFGAYPRLLALFRSIYGGLSHGELHMPPRHGRLFNPDSYPFIEGRSRGGAAQRLGRDEQSPTPRVDDGTIYQVLSRLLVLNGQQLSYRALDVEQIGSVYERLMGYRVERLTGEAVRIKAGDTGAWLSPEAVGEVAPNQRAKWFKDEWGLANKTATALAKAVNAAKTPEAQLEALEDLAFTSGSRKGAQRRVAGRLVLQPGKERIRTSSHYTPRTLSQPIVARTLEPIIKALGESPTADQLLSLKICDPAMGSGAFLVETCRFLADRVVTAWTAHGEIVAVGEQGVDPIVHARRLVAQRCLYGVDKNRFAVDLARMSLWLVTLARDEPFTFLDHALRHGDTLVGLTVEQIRAFDWEAGRERSDLFFQEIDAAVREGLEARQRILELALEEGAGFAEHKHLLLRDAEDAMRLPRLLGDILVGAWFAHDKKKAKEAERERRLAVVSAWLNRDPKGLEPPEEVLGWLKAIRDQTPVFHWALEYPEIFHETRPDPLDAGKVNSVAMMDAFVGNPPFGGQQSIQSGHGDGYIKWLQQRHPGAHGNADLSSHFFRLGADLLGPHGTLGFIATNTISQGDTRETGLRELVRRGMVIYAAAVDLPWGGAAAVTVSVVHLAAGAPSRQLQCELDGVLVAVINSRLRPSPERQDPLSLQANAGMSFLGAKVYGQGFTLTPEERAGYLESDPRNGERIFPYLGGRELNSDPRQQHSRYVISFGEMSLEEAQRWPELIDRVRRLVKPDRDRNKRAVRKKYWWRFGETAPALYRSLEPLDRCLACGRVSKHLMMAWQPTDRVFSEQLYVFPLDRDAHLGLLQSRIHERWARLLSSSMKTDLRYAASDCFETFPFPPDAGLSNGSVLDDAGKALHEARAAYCIDRDQGLTATYNDVKDPENDDPAVERLREQHLAVDRAVIEAYGWQDVPVPAHLFPESPEQAKETIRLIDAIPPFTTPETDADKRAFQRFEDAVIDQLFALNAERAAEEAIVAAAAKKAEKAAKAAAKKAKKAASKPKKKAPKNQGELL